MKCLNCGHRNRIDAHYCTACGSALNKEAKTRTSIGYGTRSLKKAALVTAGLIAVFVGGGLVHGQAKPNAEEAGQKVIAMYKEMLSKEKLDISDMQHLQETGMRKLSWVFSREDPAKVCYSFANYDLNHDGTEELLISRGWDQDGDGIRDVYALGDNNYTQEYEEYAKGDDEAKDFSEGSPMNVDMVYVFNGKEMSPVDDAQNKLWLRYYFHMLDNGTIVEIGFGPMYHDYGAGIFRIREGGEIEKDIFSIEKAMQDSSGMYTEGVCTVNGESVSLEEFTQFEEKLGEELDQEFMSADELDLSKPEWTVFWPEEAVSAAE